jgi:hypothetical protein
MTNLEKAWSSLRHQEASMRVRRYFSHHFRKIPLIFSFTNYKFSLFYFSNYALSKKWCKVLTRVAENPKAIGVG